MNVRTALSALILACVPLQSVRTEEWPRHLVLDGGGRYHLYWKPHADEGGNGEIAFRVEVRAKGYVGFGLSPNGGMAGSDIVTGWIKEGRTYFQDRHGIGNTLPARDRKQDWTLTEARENETHTTLQFRRKLNTCDDEDWAIDDGTMRVIYAYSDTDPTADHPSYHFRNRGVRSVRFLQHEPESHVDVEEDPSLLRWDVRSPAVDVSAHEFIYWCKIMKAPKMSKKHHIVQVVPLIQEGSEQLIHHMELRECVGATPEEFEGYVADRGHDCHHPNVPEVVKQCRVPMLGYTIGGEDMVLKENVGLPLKSDTFYVLEVHYDNQQRIQGIIDESGFRVHYTPNLRQYDAGLFWTGSRIGPTVLIPPGQEKFTVTGHCSPECLGPATPADGIKIFAIYSHTHGTGRRIIGRHFRGNRELPPLAVEKNFDVNYQDYKYLKEEVTILPGDQITVECTYDTSKRSTVTFGGHSSLNEMCSFLSLYYPRMEVTSVQSAPTLSTINSLLHTNFTDERSLYSLSQYNWTNVDASEMEKVFRYSGHTADCIVGNGQNIEMKSLISYPAELEPFVAEDTTCNGDLRESVSNEDVTEASTPSKASALDAVCCCPLLSLMAFAVPLMSRRRLLMGI